MAAKPTKEHVESLLTKYGQGYKDGDSKKMEAVREEVHALTDSKSSKGKK